MKNFYLNRASHKSEPTSIDSLIEKIKLIKSKSRTVLSDEDVNLLDDCLRELLELKEKPPSPHNIFEVEDVLGIILMLLKFFLNN